MTAPGVLVVGGGAAGMMAALAAREAGVPVSLLERDPKVGRKLYITGKGRCNLTNLCPPDRFLQNVPRNPKFLFSALHAFPPDRTIAFFEGLGVPLKVERGNRVFPVSDRSADVIDALFRGLRQRGVSLIQDRVTRLTLQDGALAGVVGERGVYPCRSVILATGGLSYPATGSTGDGYALARQAGHTVTPLTGSLLPWEAEDCGAMQGLSLKNVVLTVEDEQKKTLFSQQGELLFTHFGLSGPLMLSASAHLRAPEAHHYTAHIDLKPALDAQTLDARLLRELAAAPNRDTLHILETLAPKALVPLLLRRGGLSGGEKANSLTRSHRLRLAAVLKDCSFPLLRPRPIEEAVVTAGGVDVREVDPKTMASKKLPGLYLAGELLDVDAYTGGFNLQIAWSTGRAAGLAAGLAQKGACAP